MPESVIIVDPTTHTNILKPNPDGSLNIGASALPAGAATSARQAAPGVAGSPSTDVTSVQGVSGGTPQNVNLAPVAGTPVLYRSAVTSADVLAAVGTVTCTNPATGAGSLSAGTYHISVSAGRTGYGRGLATVGNTTVATSGSNLSVRAAFAQVANADWYDVFATTAANPLWAGRITEAQRAAGCVITAVGVVGAGGTAGAVDIQAIGTGLADNTQLQSTAFIPDHLSGSPTPLGANKNVVDIDAVLTRTGDGVAAALTVLVFVQNTVSGIWSGAAAATTFSYGVAAGSYGPMTQRLRINNQGAAIHVLVASIAGTGAAVDLYEIVS